MTDETYALLSELMKKGKITQKDKRWFTEKINKAQKHELMVACMNWFAEDPEAKYYVGAGAGSAMGIIGVLIGDLEESGLIPKQSQDGGLYNPNLFDWLRDPISTGSAEVADYIVTGKIEFGGSWENNFSGILEMAGISFAGLCASAIILKAMNPEGSGGAGLMSLVSGLI